MITSRHPAFAKLGPKLRRIARELANLDDFLRLNDALAPELTSRWGRTTAMAATIANSYNGMEDVLSNIARDVDGNVPKSESWHQDLLDQMLAGVSEIRPPLLDDDLHAQLSELRGFRHRARDNYGFDLDAVRTEENLRRLQRVFPAFVAAIQTLADEIARDA